jgi:hypothetical protein
MYSHDDEKWLDELIKYLKPIERQFPTAMWSDKQLRPGDRWTLVQNEAPSSAKVVLLLVSPSFLASDFIHDQEFGPALDAANKASKKILWVLVATCLWQQTALKDYQPVNDVRKPFSSLSRWQHGKQLDSIATEVLKWLN